MWFRKERIIEQRIKTCRGPIANLVRTSHPRLKSIALARCLGRLFHLRMLRTAAAFLFWALAVCCAPQALGQNSATSSAPSLQSKKASSSVDQLIPWLLDEDRQLSGLAFSDVIFDATGKRVLTIDPKNETDQRVIKQISGVLDEVLKRMNASDSVIQKIPRINEVSSHFEDLLRELLNATPGLSCDVPHTAEDRAQRSGYPDLRLVDLETKRIFYLDPKLYAAGSRDSSFRTFYFEPKIATNKVRDDAVHLIAGFEHEPRSEGHWKFTRWDLVDLAHFKVKLKAEFQGSNHDIYRPEAVVATSAK